MNRRLLLARHAKSSWDDPSQGDFERPLAPRGVGALPRMADHLAATGASPDLVLCSPATRTRATLDGIRSALSDAAAVEYVNAIYGAAPTTLLRLVHEVDDAVGCLMLVGHNPGLQELALSLCGAGAADLRRQLWEKYPTGAIATLSFEGAWSDLGAGEARLDDLFLPRRPRS